MRVGELIELLQDLDENAEVMIMTQRSYPFENALAGVAVRGEMGDDEDDEDDEEDEEEGDDEDDEESRHENGTAPNDVFLVEGRQLRCGSKAAWRVARR